MSDEDYPDFEHEVEPRVFVRDVVIERAKGFLLERFFVPETRGVFYGRQIEVAVEDDFFHWITKKALNELAETGVIASIHEQLGHHAAHFYYPRRHRFPRRQIAETIKLIREFSEPTFTRALGAHCELLVDAAMAGIGFRIRQRRVREVDGKRWTTTNHDLDRVIERDGIRYGVEVKNQLGYIDQAEFAVKLAMCKHFDVRPMFVARMMPKSYVYEVYRAGGFCLLFKDQQYPLLADDLARRVRRVLHFPVAAIREFPNTALARFENWHARVAGLG